MAVGDHVTLASDNDGCNDVIEAEIMACFCRFSGLGMGKFYKR